MNIAPGSSGYCRRARLNGFLEKKLIYFDNSSTTPEAPEVIKTVSETASEIIGNPSSLHEAGLRAEKKVSEARKIFASAVGALPEEIFFNSGGTEGDNAVISGVARMFRKTRKKMISTKVEHPAVLEPLKRLEQDGWDVVLIGVDGKGRPDMEALRRAAGEDTALVSMMTVNNETGAVMPVREAAEIAHSCGALFHTDAVQAFGKMSLKDTGADFITVSGHKFHGPMGTGAMYVKKGISLPPLILGGGQERGLRSGTENVPGIAGFGEAVRLAVQEENAADRRIREVREELLSGILSGIPGVRVNSPEDGAPSVLNVSFTGTRGEVILHMLEQRGLYVSTGSACSSHKKGLSPVLTAMGLTDEETESAVRFSFSRYNTVEEAREAAEIIKDAVSSFRKLGDLRRRGR